MCFASEVTAWKHGYVMALIQLAREFRIVALDIDPQVKRGIGHADVDNARQDRQGGGKFFAVQAAVFDNMGLIFPCGDARLEYRRTHGAAMISAVEQKFREQLGVTGNESRAHARHVGSFRQAGKYDQSRISVAAQLLRGLQRAQGRLRLVKIDLGITFIGCNHKAILVGQVE